VSDAGEETPSEPIGLRSGILDSLDNGVCTDMERAEFVKDWLGRAWGLGVVKLRGLKLCPTKLSDVFTLEFHGGLSLLLVEKPGRGNLFPVGVAEPPLEPGDGDDVPPRLP
jgi:hypothetical protein